MLLLLLLCVVLFLTFPPQCVVLWIISVCVCGGLLDGVSSSNLHNWIYRAANIFYTVLGTVCLITSGVSYPWLWSTLVVFCHCIWPLLWHCLFVVVLMVVYSPFRPILFWCTLLPKPWCRVLSVLLQLLMSGCVLWCVQWLAPRPCWWVFWLHLTGRSGLALLRACASLR